MPDGVTLGKGLSAGAAAVGAAVVNPALASALCIGEDTTATFAWSPLGCAAAAENLRIIEDEFLHARAALVGPVLLAGIRSVLGRHFGERASVRGVGMMIGAEVSAAAGGESSAALARQIMVRCKRAGLLVGASWDWKTVVFLPPLIMTETLVEEAVGRLDEAVAGVARASGRSG
jgi:4-aminobutyrate aminotransferase